MAVDPDLAAPPTGVMSAEAGKPDQQETGYDDGSETVDKKYWLACLEDAERAEKDWRERAREIIQIYRNETRSSRTGRLSSGPVTFNILYANTEVMLPAVYQKPPQPVVRSRFVKVAEPMPPPVMPGMPPPGMPPGMGGPLPPAGLNGNLQPSVGMPMPPAAMGGPPPPMPPPGLAVPPSIPQPPGGGPGLAGPPASGVGAPPVPPGLPMDAAGPVSSPQLGPPAGPPPPMPPQFGMVPGQMPPPAPFAAQPAPGRPPQRDVETAASIMEKALEIIVDDEHSNEAIKHAIKDVLLAGRGTCRVRWKPQMQKQPVMAGDGLTPLPEGGIEGAEPAEEEVKIWEQVDDEYVYWEDLLVDPVRAAADTNWLAFRHLFTREALEQEFSDSPEVASLMQQGKLSDLLKWTDEAAAKSPVGGGSSMKTASNLGDHVRKAMIWEIWDRVEKRIIWFCRELSGMVLRVDPDSYQLQGFFPCPVPMLAVTTTDSRIPRPYYDLYSRLAADLDETSKRISDLTRQVKMKGAYNAASPEIKDLLTAGDGKMIPVDGVDLLSNGLQNHIWMLPLDPVVQSLNQLYLAREQQKQSIYEIMGISDLMRGATKATETATAQRIKGSMGVSRLEDQKQQAGNFVRDLLRLKAELIAQNFDAHTLEAMTGEEVTPAVEAILRDDFQRTCSIDIEADSTVVVDQQVEQEAMTQIAQTMQMVMQGGQAMLMTGVLPPPQVMQLTLEMLKMFLHPVRFSRGVVELINDFQEQLSQQIAMQAMMPPQPIMPPQPPVGAPAGALPPGGRPPGQAGSPRPNPGGQPAGANGGAPNLPPRPTGPNAGMPPPPMM